MLASHTRYTADDGTTWIVEKRDYGSGDVDYTMITPDGVRVEVDMRWYNGRVR